MQTAHVHILSPGDTKKNNKPINDWQFWGDGSKIKIQLWLIFSLFVNLCETRICSKIICGTLDLAKPLSDFNVKYSKERKVTSEE